MILSFTLSMPGRAAWNGKWSGADNSYIVTRALTVKAAAKADGLDGRSFHYDFGDGWGASVAVKIVAAAESRRLRRKSNGFCGYEWMVQDLIDYGEILGSARRPKQPGES